jgi:hypothetical protein
VTGVQTCALPILLLPAAAMAVLIAVVLARSRLWSMRTVE